MRFRRVHRINQLAFVKFFTSNVGDPFAFLGKAQRGRLRERAIDCNDVIHVVSVESSRRGYKNVVRLIGFELVERQE